MGRSNVPPAAPLVSIITPAYNAGRFIEYTLESAIRQTFTRFELIVVDDGSTDQTFAIASSYARRDPRIRVLQQANRGIAVARNTAMRAARGRLFALLDSDDLWFPTYLAEQLAVLEAHPEIAVLSANALNFGGPLDGEPLLHVRANDGVLQIPLLHLVQIEDAMSILALFRRDVSDAIGLFDESLRRSEDYDFWLRAARAGFQLAVNPKPLGLYRRRPDSLSSDESLMLEAMRRPLLKLREACADLPVVQDAVDQQLARFARRSLVADARSALVKGDMPELASTFSALAETTGDTKYRLARWLAGHAPLTIRVAYRCKQLLGPLTRASVRPAHLPTITAGDRL